MAGAAIFSFLSSSSNPTGELNRTPALAAAADGQPQPAPALTPPAEASARRAEPQPARSREFDPAINPYAPALREPGKSKRPWDVTFLQAYQNASSNQPIRFELTGGVMAAGVIKITQYRNGELTYLSGELTEPEPGKFFFLTPPEGSRSGPAVGIIEFPASKRAYRIEPTGENGAPELWERRLEEVVCLAMPLVEEGALEDETANIPPLNPSDVPEYVPGYNDGIVSLQSYPGSRAVILLDFFGGYTPTWGGVTYPKPNVSNAQIRDLWKRVAEDYLPFNINVTTDRRVYEAAPANSRQRCVFSPSISAMPSGAAGVAYIGSWDWGSDTVCWSIYISGKSGAEVGSHELGHTLTLGHDGDSSSGYYAGHGSGAVGWAPIMGAGYYKNVVQWCKGEYTGANNTQDDLAIIVNEVNVDYRPDDTGAALGSARYLELFPGNIARSEGVIETTGDTDAFRFTTTGGAVSLTARPVGDWANLAISLTLADATDTVIASNNPQTQLHATLSSAVPAGTYTVRVTGAGRNNPLTDGFSSYASLGYYSVTGTVAGAVLPTRLSVAERSPVGTVVGTVPANSSGDPLAYAIVSGNTGNTFNLDNTGVLRVANNTLLDYNRLATNTMLAVQFELFVNITNLANPALTELNRRVVVAVLDINDPPVVTGFTAAVIEHTRPGTVVGSVKVSDPDFFQVLSYSFAAGNSNGAFAIDPGGQITVAAGLSRAVQSVYSLTVAVADDHPTNPLVGTGYVTIQIITNGTPFQPGSVRYARYDSLGSGTAVADLTNNARWPRDPSSDVEMPSFEGEVNRADNYGAALRAFLLPPATGVYTFWIASDDSSELWYSPTTNTTSLARIAYVSGYTSSRQWTKFSSQQSAAFTLYAGQACYLEARMKEGGGGDHIAVAWRGPATAGLTNVIPGLYLAPYELNYTPRLTGFNVKLHRDAITGAAVGKVAVSDANSRDSHSFAIVSGNSAGLFTIDADSGVVRVADSAALQAAAGPSYTLQVRATDSGAPPLSATANATITLVAPETITATQIQRELWYDISGSTVANLTNSAAYPRRPAAFAALTRFEAPADIADNYGSRVRALVTPPASGTYRFFIASDDASSLLFSANTNGAGAARIAYVSGYTSANNWTANASQMSSPINLVAGQAYYLEALHKEGGGGDHLSVAWAGPGIVDTNGAASTNIIAGSYLSPVDLNYAPQIASQALRVFASAPNGTPIGTVTATDSALDTLAFQIVDGNTNNLFALHPGSGVLTVADNSLLASGAVTNVVLTVQVQDSGCGGLYPRRSAQATVTVSVQSTNAPYLWTGGGMNNNWSDAGNWGGGTLYPGVRLIFGWPARQANVNDIATTLGWVQLTNGGFNLSGAPVTLQSGLTNTAGVNTWNLDTSLAAAQTWSCAGGELTVGGAITNNGFTLGVVAAADLRLEGPISGAGGLSKSGASRLLMQGAHAYTGPTILASASGTTSSLEVSGANDLDIGGSDVTLNGRMDLWNHNATIGALNGSGMVFANNGLRTLTLGANNHSGSFSGLIQNSSWASGVKLALVKTGTGTQSLWGTNTFTGGTTVSNGTLVIPGGGTIFSGPVTVYSPGLLAVDTSSGHKTAAVTLAGDGQIRKTGVNNFVLQASNTFSGAFLVNGGYLVFDGLHTAAGRPALNLSGGSAALGAAFVNNTCTVSSLSGNGPLNVAYGSDTGTRTLEVHQDDDTVYSGPLNDGGAGRVLALRKSGGGRLTLAGASGFTGPTEVAAGSLQLNGALTASPITVSALARLEGQGNAVAGVTLHGTVSPGADGPGTLTSGSQTWHPLARYDWQLRDPASPGGWDTLAINGTLTLAATPANPFVIRLFTLDETNAPGPAPGFDKQASYRWTLAATTAGIVNYDPAAFVLDTSGFSNDFSGGTFLLTVSSNALVLDYVPPAPPQPPQFTGYASLGEAGFQLSVSGAPNSPWTLLTAESPAMPLPAWTPLATGYFSPEGRFLYTDPEATNHPQRFYRVVSP